MGKRNQGLVWEGKKDEGTKVKMYEQMKNICMVQGEHRAQDLPSEELT